MTEYISKEDWINGANVPTNDFSAIPADADIRELALVGYEEICPEAWTE